MKKAALTLPEIMLIAGTRVMVGAGGALLLADYLKEDKRKKIGWTLFLIGCLSTIPLAIDVFSKRK
jgi:H+/gluconate symporter-like permease